MCCVVSSRTVALQAALFSFATGVLAASYKLILCGFRAGGAKAQHAAVRLLQHLDTANNHLLPGRNVVCVTFGVPEILRVKVTSSSECVVSSMLHRHLCTCHFWSCMCWTVMQHTAALSSPWQFIGSDVTQPWCKPEAR